MSSLPPFPSTGAAIGLDHVGIVGADLGKLAGAFTEAGFHLTPRATHASGRTENRCVILRDGGYLELISVVPGQSSATLDRFLARGPGAHILALEVADTVAASDRLRRAGIASEIVSTERETGQPGGKVGFALIMPPDTPEGRVLLVQQLTRGLLWRADNVSHPNGAVALIEAVYGTDSPAEAMNHLSRLTGRPAQPDPLGGFRIRLGQGWVRFLSRSVAVGLFPGATGAAPLLGLTIATEHPTDQVFHIAGVAIRLTAATA